MREVVLDTETTGLSPKSGDRIVEIGCVELINHLPTGQNFHEYINPERDMPEQAEAVHGLSEEFLSDKPLFADVSAAFDEFIGDSPLIIHNAEFDMGFLNAERKRLGFDPIPMVRAVDTVQMARRKFPGSQVNLDALCRRFSIDISDRALHGALKDARLLAEVYLELIGGRQQGLELAAETATAAMAFEKNQRPPRPHAPSAEEAAAHAQFLKKLSKPIWKA
ncbi:MAG: DNA polymerase III subunit epsilon [Alphaproteobacteria bacterium]|nr:DNA polymerase III subunit epsilon [Alphaproteobacteria bacterium]MBT7943986.1 DNA polymerase III subunit epsilon [Alphaproteobacteria bacterium]